MHLTLAVIILANSAVIAQDFIPIGGGSGASSSGRPTIGNNNFGEGELASQIWPANDPRWQPANIPGNRPNPIPLFTKSQQAGTPHEGPIDLTFIHQHSYKEPFRNDQTLNSFTHAVGAARPNIPRTLGREMVFIDKFADPNSPESLAATEKKKNMVFFGLAPPVEKLHRADEFAPSNVPLQNPWDAWYDRFTEPPAEPRRLYPLTQTKRPNIVAVPFYAADRQKREVAESQPSTEPTTSTTPAATAATVTEQTTPTTFADAAIEATTTSDVTVLIETTTRPAENTTTAATTASTASLTATSTTVAAATSSKTSTAAAATSTATTASTTTAPTTAPSSSEPDVTVSIESKPLNSTQKPETNFGLTTQKDSISSTTPTSPGPTIAFRPRHRSSTTKFPTTLPSSSTVSLPSTVAPSTSMSTATTLSPTTSVVKKMRAKNNRRVPLRTTLNTVTEGTSSATTASATPSTRKWFRIDTAVGSVKNPHLTTKLPIRTSTLSRRANLRSRVPLRRLHNNTTTAATKTTTAAPAASSAGSTAALLAAVTSASSSASTASATASPSSATPTTVSVTSPSTSSPNSTVSSPTTSISLASTLNALNRSTTTTLVNATTHSSLFTTVKPKPMFRVFRPRRPPASGKLPARTPISGDSKEELDSNTVGALRTEVNRLLSTVVQLQSTVISQQQRISQLENQLRLRRSFVPRKEVDNKTFVDSNGRTVQRTTIDVRKGRAARQNLNNSALSQQTLRQRSSLA